MVEFEYYQKIILDKDYKWSMPNKWTFKMKPVDKFISSEILNAKKILIPFAGETRFSNAHDITYIDIEEDRPKPYILGDCRDVMEDLIKQKKKYNLIILDPPFTFFQAVRTYNNQKMQDISYIRNLTDKLLFKGGIVISCGFNSTGMNSKKYNRKYEKIKLLLVNHGGSHNDTIILKERKLNQLEV